MGQSLLPGKLYGNSISTQFQIPPPLLFITMSCNFAQNPYSWSKKYRHILIDWQLTSIVLKLIQMICWMHPTFLHSVLPHSLCVWHLQGGLVTEVVLSKLKSSKLQKASRCLSKKTLPGHKFACAYMILCRIWQRWFIERVFEKISG